LDVGGFDPDLRGYEDDDLFLRFFLAGYSNYFTPEPVTVWTINKASTSFSELMSHSRFVYFKKLLDRFPKGSLGDTKIFGELLAPRFAFHFADDVIASTFTGDGHLKVRLERLKFCRDLVKLSDEFNSSFRIVFLVATAPLVGLSPWFLKVLLLFLLRVGDIFGSFGIPVFSKFIRKYSSKEIMFRN
jgi:hypothetical protein